MARIFELDKIYQKKNLGAVISDYVQVARVKGINVQAIREIVCEFTEGGACKIYKVKIGKNEYLIDDVQHAELMTFANV